MGLVYGTHMGPIWATHIWANPCGTHAEPGCTPHMGSPYGTHIGMLAGMEIMQLLLDVRLKTNNFKIIPYVLGRN